MAEWKDIKLNLTVYHMPAEKPQLRGVSGVYFLVNHGIVEYAGRSVNIENRLNNHHVYDPDYHNEIWVFETPPGVNFYNHIVSEINAIHRLRPIKNGTGAN